MSAAQLRDKIKEIAVALTSREEYAMFLAVVVDGVHQARVAKEFKVDQTTVSRVVARVRDAVSTELLRLGVAV